MDIKETEGTIIAINRLKMTTDGDGITSLVGLSACPLDCKYCINKKELLSTDLHKKMTVLQLIEALSVDDIYFRATGGGATFGGGEPLIQHKFIEAFAKTRPDKWNIYIETSLNVKWNAIENLLPFVSQWIVDIKSADPDIYTDYAKADSAQVFDNLERISQSEYKNRLCIKVPIIPAFKTEEQAKKEALFISKKYGLDEDQIEVFEYKTDFRYR